MAEQSENFPESQQALNARLEEHLAKGKLAKQKMPSIIDQLSKAFKDETDSATPVVKELINVGKLEADTNWAEAMINAGIPFDKILQVWDIKDQNSRDSRERSNPQVK